MRRAAILALPLAFLACADPAADEPQLDPLVGRDRAQTDMIPYDRSVSSDPRDAARPDAARPDPDAARPDAARPDAALPDPDAARPDAALDPDRGIDHPDASPDQGGEDLGDPIDDDPVLRPDPGINAGWIGGPCESDDDCAYDDGVCLGEDEGFPRGQCTQDCVRTCPDAAGMPTTFCVEDILQEGACVQRCDFDAFGASGCRPGYVCELRPRHTEPDLERGVCVPGVEEFRPIDACFDGLDAAQCLYERREPRVDHPEEFPALSCVVSGPLWLSSPIGGVTYRYVTHDAPQPMFVSCELAAALVQLSALLREYDIVEVGHIGTYNCRVIRGTERLSQHSHGYAIDLQWFRTAGGDTYNVVDHWEHENVDWGRGEAGPFETEAGRILYEIGWQMHARRIFNTVLTPDYNAAHDNHFHVDLHPDQVYIGLGDWPGYIGPNLHGD